MVFGMFVGKKGETAFVIRDCERGLRHTQCIPDPYGGSLECYCRTDLCNDGRSISRSTNHSPASAPDVTLLIVVCLSVILIQVWVKNNNKKSTN